MVVVGFVITGRRIVIDRGVGLVVVMEWRLGLTNIRFSHMFKPRLRLIIMGRVNNIVRSSSKTIDIIRIVIIS